MVERIIGMFCCLLCAWPFFIVSYFNKDSKEPMGFWTGDAKKIKSMVKNVKDYNCEMSHLYAKCSLAFVITGILFLIDTILGVAGVVFDCTAGIYIVWRLYKNILSKYS